MATNREIAEALGYRCALLSTRREHPRIWVINNPDGLEMLRNSTSEDAAWGQLLDQEIMGEPTIPDYTHNPAAALGLLAGCTGYRANIQIGGGFAECWLEPPGGATWETRGFRAGWHTPEEIGAAVALAACDAWAAWRAAQGAQSEEVG